MNDKIKKEQLNQLELMKEILVQNMQVNYQTYSEILSKLDILSLRPWMCFIVNVFQMLG